MKKIFLLILMFVTSTTNLTFGEEIDSTKPYERFVGLGICCMTRWQIDLHLPNRCEVGKESFGG